MESLKIKKIDEDVKLPARAHPGDSGMDVYAHSFKRHYLHSGSNGEQMIETDIIKKRAEVEDKIELCYLERVMIGTGLKVAVPQGYEVQVRPRSGLALKQGLTVLNTPGTVDSGYRDEICIILVNLSRANRVVSIGDRIAQLVVSEVELCDVEEVTELPEAEDRGEAGFGSTGV